MLLLLFHNFCSGNTLNLASSLSLVPGTTYSEQAQVSFLFHVNCSRNSKYGTDKKTCCSPYPVPGTLFREQKRCTRPIYYNFAPRISIPAVFAALNVNFGLMRSDICKPKAFICLTPIQHA